MEDENEAIDSTRLCAASYVLKRGKPGGKPPLMVCRVLGKRSDDDTWKVQRGGMTFGKDNAWELEPVTFSGFTREYLSIHRYSTLKEAIAAAKRAPDSN